MFVFSKELLRGWGILLSHWICKSAVCLCLIDGSNIVCSLKTCRHDHAPAYCYVAHMHLRVERLHTPITLYKLSRAVNHAIKPRTRAAMPWQWFVQVHWFTLTPDLLALLHAGETFWSLIVVVHASWCCMHTALLAKGCAKIKCTHQSAMAFFCQTVFHLQLKQLWHLA